MKSIYGASAARKKRFSVEACSNFAIIPLLQNSYGNEFELESQSYLRGER